MQHVFTLTLLISLFLSTSAHAAGAAAAGGSAAYGAAGASAATDVKAGAAATAEKSPWEDEIDTELYRQRLMSRKSQRHQQLNNLFPIFHHAL
jgi:hypothetical protein